MDTTIKNWLILVLPQFRYPKSTSLISYGCYVPILFGALAPKASESLILARDQFPEKTSPKGQNFIVQTRTDFLSLYLFLGFSSAMKSVCGYSTGLMHQPSLPISCKYIWSFKCNGNKHDISKSKRKPKGLLIWTIFLF